MSNTQKIFKNFTEYASSYVIGYDEKWKSLIFVEATQYNSDNKPILWAVRRNSNVFSKITSQFGHEPTPTNKIKGFEEEYRFNSAEEAVKAWQKSIKK